MSSTALVTIALGAKHERLWDAHCRPRWEAYADHHGYDVICLREPLDRSPRAAARSPAWQKCLVLSQPFADRYERVVWVDSDVVINPAAPPIADGVPAEMVGAVDEYATPTRELYRQSLLKLYRHWETTGGDFARNETPADFYAAYGLPAHHDAVVQTGVMVFSPRHHRELLERVYHGYEDRGGALWSEWRPLSFELLEAGVVEWIDPRFNHPWLIHKALHAPALLADPAHPRAAAVAAEALASVHFLHFAGSVPELALVDAHDGPVPQRERARSRPRAAVTTPVALFAFARPDTTERVLAAIEAARPPKLLVATDAPAPDRPDLAGPCAEVRRLIDAIDWDCEVLTNHADRHMGLDGRIVSGLDWVFDAVEEAIVLEDDCLPHPSFFGFCEETLRRYRSDDRVTTVSGNCFDFGSARGGASYRFSRYPLIWGWATWRRAWRAHDPALRRWPELRDSGWLERRFDDPHAVAYWAHRFDQAQRGEGSWDYAWTFSSWLADGLTVVPAVNLVANVGFRADATNTRGDDLSPFANLPTEPIGLPLRHPSVLAADDEGDRLLEGALFSGNVHRMFARLRRSLHTERAGA